ncbi:MAG: hypothetical protein Q7J98_11435, partial [Kiritimatiellia bacterium]|nr:hypothetical protein [Kiritimatiellia bacterium]
IVSNIAGTYGGGISQKSGSSSGPITDCLISNNIAGASGGGVHGYATYIDHCVIANNQCSKGANEYEGGGGVQTYYDSIYNSILEGNMANGNGGGFYFTGGTVRNCLIRNNTAVNVGGGIYMGIPSSGYHGYMYSCTVVSNYADNGGGSYDAHTANYATYNNCIIYFNSASGTASNCYVSADSSVVFCNCCFSPALESSGPSSSFTNNTTDNPQFRDSAAGDYHLKSSSPCVNTGTNQAWMTDGVDLDGKPRIRYGTVDMGVYECIYKGTIFSF